MSYKKYQAWKETPINQTPYLSVIIPAYNEEERIIPTIGAIASHVSIQGYPWELVIADDGSTDNTIELVKSLGLANVRILVASKNGGKGSAVQRGILAARGEYILFVDADNSTPIEELESLLSKIIEKDFDIAIGSRAVEGAEEMKRSFFRQLLSDGLRWIVKYVFQIGVRDTQCGFKLYSREAAMKLHNTQTEMGFSFDLEILYLASKYGFKVAEVPVAWIDAPGSKVNTHKEAQRFLIALAKIKINDLRGSYAGLV
ncbi:MAG: glycosyltransferase family 2 protein [Chloroflexi bacterium]|nr:glycosyltransferase family 2 protein [Chloroflexota bacterium]